MRLRLVSVVLASIVLVFAGCAKRSSPSETAAGGLKVLRLGNNADPRDLDPHIDVAYTDYNILIALF